MGGKVYDTGKSRLVAQKVLGEYRVEQKDGYFTKGLEFDSLYRTEKGNWFAVTYLNKERPSPRELGREEARAWLQGNGKWAQLLGHFGDCEGKEEA